MKSAGACEAEWERRSMTEESQPQDVDHIKSLISNLPPKVIADLIAEAVRNAPSEYKQASISELIRNASAQDRIVTVVAAVRTATDKATKRDIAAAAVDNLPDEAKLDIEKKFLTPSEHITVMVVRTFAILSVFLLFGLIATIIFRPENVRDMVALFTTIAGTTAGFIAGRGSLPSGPS
jgi:hypothetical protein